MFTKASSPTLHEVYTPYFVIRVPSTTTCQLSTVYNSSIHFGTNDTLAGTSYEAIKLGDTVPGTASFEYTGGPTVPFDIAAGTDWTFDFFGNALGDNVWIKGSGSHGLQIGDKVMFENAITETGTSQSGGVSGGGGTAKIKLASDAGSLLL